MKMKKYNIDLHIHSVLSPCANLLMTPANILKKAKEKGLDIIAITDHNSAKNVKVAMSLAKKYGINIIPGMEVESSEEIHLLCFFPDIKKLLSFQKIIYKNLPKRENDEEYFGYQLLTDEKDDYRAKEKRMLATAVNLNINQIVNKTRGIGGIVIPSHVDKSYGIIKNLGFIPEDLNFKILEISKNSEMKNLKEKYSYLNNYILIKNSDSHYLDEIKIMSQLKLKNFNFENLFKNLKSGNFNLN